VALSLDRGWSVRIDPADKQAVKEHPRAARWFPASVPGSVQTDLMAAGLATDPYVGLNEKDIQWAGLSGWQYRTRFDADPDMLARENVDLVFEGVDTFAEVTLNGTRLASMDNAHRRWRLPVKSLLRPGGNELVVTFKSPIRHLQPMVLALEHPLPGEYDSMFGDEPQGKQTSPYIRKPKYHYGWDWGPRIVNIGLWKPVRLEGWDAVRVEALRVRQIALSDEQARLSADLDLAVDGRHRLKAVVRVSTPDGAVSTFSQDAKVAPGGSAVSVPVTIDRPRLWQPVGFGDQPLYRLQVEVRDESGTVLARAERRTGLRTVELRRQADEWGRGLEIVVNGHAIFAKGANLIPFDSFPSRVTDAQRRRILQGAKDANMNMLRVWGGGYYLDDAFYDMADEMGIMIWQDFMFGGAVTPYDRDFRENVRIEAEEQVDRLQAHPSIVLWCGNNEVLAGWETWGDRIAFKKAVGADEQERVGVGMAVLFDEVLRGAVAARDADVPYWPGSPSTNYEGRPEVDHDGDRHFWDVWGGKKPVEAYLDNTPRFMSEYGLQAMPVMRTIDSFAKAGDKEIESPVMRAHQKYLKGDGNQRLMLYIRNNYGEPKDFADFVYLSQVMQAEGIELAALHHRASRPRTMGSLYWQINDVWPGASWSSIDYYGRWKALNYHARRFFAPVAIAALRKDGVTRVSLISDRLVPQSLHWRLRVMDTAGAVLSNREGEGKVPASSVIEVAALPDAELFAGADPARSFAVAEIIGDDGAVLSRSLVTMRAPKDMMLPDPGITASVTRDPQGIALTLHATRLARAVWIDLGDVDAAISDNAFDLLPGESRTIRIDTQQSLARIEKQLAIRSLFGVVLREAP
jgi:beta-mannosidase